MRAARVAAKLSNIKVLMRRRDFLMQQISEDAEPSAWDRRELEALHWAIDTLDQQ